MEPLPAESRITSRIEGDLLQIVIPVGARASGCIFASPFFAAIFSFLGVTFCAQGMFGHNSLWFFPGMVCLAVGLVTIAALGGIYFRKRKPGVMVEIGADFLSITSQLPAVSSRLSWLRDEVGEIIVANSPNSHGVSRIQMHRKDGTFDLLPVRLSEQELRWMAEQVRIRWKMSEMR